MSAGAAVSVRAGRLWYGLSNCGLALRFSVAGFFTAGTEACRPRVRLAKMREQSKRRTAILYESRVSGRSRQTLENHPSPMVLCPSLVACIKGRNRNKALGGVAFQQHTSGFNRESAIGSQRPGARHRVAKRFLPAAFCVHPPVGLLFRQWLPPILRSSHGRSPTTLQK